MSLKVKAKKASGSMNYSLEIVGWSDDGILNITPSVGGFLQNTTGVGDEFVPVASGFGTNDFNALAGESLADHHQYYESSGTNNTGGDHYLLSNTPVVTGTLFDWYEIPLKIHEDKIDLGKSKDYSMSSFFEHLYMDIYPLPSGASIAAVQLCVKHKPSNAMHMSVVGSHLIERIDKFRSEGKLFPSPLQDLDRGFPRRGSPSGIITDRGPNYAPLSSIENIPHAYKRPNTAKTNYSRRWRGLNGLAKGPYDPDMFGFGFENPLLDSPFLSGIYAFDNDDGLTIKSKPLGDGFGTLQGTMTTSYTQHHLENIGWRFSSGTLFEDFLPGWSGNYTTTDWTSLSNGSNNLQSHELYGKISDGFNNAVRISGSNSYLNFGDVDISDQFSMFIRFTPDVNVSGSDYNLFNSGVLFSKWDTGNDLEFALSYSGGYLRALARDNVGTIISAQDSLPYTSYQYPLSVIVTHHNSSGLRLYTDNELTDPFNTLRASTAPFTINTGSSQLMVGNCTGSGVGMNMFVSEFGISDRLNVVDTSGVRGIAPDLTVKETTADRFLSGHRIKFWQQDTDSTDRCQLWDYVDEDTLDWDLGAFKYCHFGVGFDGFTKRSGRDLITFDINHHGSGYMQNSTKDMPASVSSGVAYHTQIENDFLRFNLSDASDNFWAADRRITKSVPRGYKFSDKALVVETVLEHDTYSDIAWQDGEVGPKLIVSLYTTNKDPKTYEADNYGLINRDIHYLEPSGCWRRIDSKFTYNNYLDKSEAWALFPKEKVLTEFDHKYYSQDINNMFLQYDLVYPSGDAFNSRINIHSAHVRLEDAFVNPVKNSGSLDLTVSGEKRERENLNLLMLPSFCQVTNLDSGNPFCSGMSLGLYPSGLPLYLLPVSESGILQSSGFPLHASGSVWSSNDMPVYLRAIGDASGNLLPMYTSGEYKVEGSMPLSLKNENLIYPHSGKSINFHTFGSSVNAGAKWITMPLFLTNNGLRDPLSIATQVPSGLVLHTIGDDALLSLYRDAYLALVTKAPQDVYQSMNMLLWVDDSLHTDLSVENSLNLHTANYGGRSVGSPYIYWSNVSYGLPKEPDDNIFASVDADNEIRGVELICYGSCDSASAFRCDEAAVISHGVNWRDDACVDGGILRASNTYTNPTASGFGNTIGYSGNYYGIRKYTGLFPGVPYNIVVEGQTGSLESINMPREWEDWEYGICGLDWDVDGCCTSGCDQNLAHSGVKVIADNPTLKDGTVIPSGRMSGDKFGKSVAVVSDLMVVGAPYHEHDEKGGNTVLTGVRAGNPTLEWNGGSGLEKAGALFVYRRQNPISGGHKAPWDLEEKIVLPSAFRADYFRNSPGTISFGGLPTIPIRKWHIGQEGRELGWSVGAAQAGDREVIVASAPSSKWSRNYDDVVTSGVQVGVMVFTDEFEYTGDKGEHLNSVIREQNFIYRYYSKPINVEKHTVHLDLKVIVCQPTGIFGNKDDNFSLASFIHHKKMGRNYGATSQQIFNSMKSVFLEAFPYDATKIHNNIPPVLGICVDDSRSLGRDDLEPALDDFKKWYQDYSFASGVKDFFGVVDSGHLYERFPPRGAAEDWVQLAGSTIRDVVDSGRLVEDDGMRFISGGIGIEYANENLTEFNVPPASGGRVYVFEKEGADWQLIQEIKTPSEPANDFEATVTSPDIYKNDPTIAGPDDSPPDRFGHAISISKDAEVITVGSPYIEDSCIIYEYDERERARMYKGLEGWYTHKSYTDKYDTLQNYTKELGEDAALKRSYSELTASEKFDFRSDESYWGSNKISEYKKIFTYGYNDIGMQGTWQFIPNTFAPTSRLGYSTDVSEDGNIAVFGAPTDSINEFEDSNVYYRYLDTWSSYVNAGAVRVFDSRKYYPHSGVVEYNKFGNLGRSLDPNNPERYEHVGQALNVSNIPFHTTQFAEGLDIPEEAGAAFIITPEVDASSDEIIKNIKDWMSLGDRNLVLVGNDPVWEANGKYRKSNDIINTILEKLGSRMRLHAARNEYEALSACPVDGKPNIIKSFSPAGSRTTEVSSDSMYGHGVADIRMHVPGVSIASPCDDLNSKCEMHLQHKGDLRAEWSSECTTGGKCNQTHRYQSNWPWHFGSVPNPCIPCDGDSRLNIAPGFEPKPILVAAEYTQPYSYETPPASSQIFVDVERKEWIPPGEPTTSYIFADQHKDEAEFIWDSGNSDYKLLHMGKFHDPDLFEYTDKVGNSAVRDAVSQFGPAELTDPTTKTIIKKLPGGDLVLAAQERWASNSTSNVVMIGAVTPESEAMLTEDYDFNVSFYLNLVRQSCTENGRIVQLGGWTNVTKFTDAYKRSLLKDLFFFKGNDVVENWTGDIPSTRNVCWIACPKGTPSEEDADRIKAWMNTGNKTLVITYPNQMSPDDTSEDYDDYENVGAHAPPSQTIARNVSTTCEALGIEMKPLYLKGKDRFATRLADGDPDLTVVHLDDDDKIFTGCNSQEIVKNFFIEPDMENGAVPGSEEDPIDAPIPGGNQDDGIHNYKERQIANFMAPNFIPISLASASKKLIWLPEEQVGDEVSEVVVDKNSIYWQMKSGISQVHFPIDSGLPVSQSGYRIFIDWVSETPNEDGDIDVYWNNAVKDPDVRYDTASDATILYDVDWSTGKKVKYATLPAQVTCNDCTEPPKSRRIKNGITLQKNGIENRVQSTSIDLRILPSGSRQTCCDEIRIFFDGNQQRGRTLEQQEHANSTVRIVSVSGALLPIEEKVEVSEGRWKRWTDSEPTDRWTVRPGHTITIPGEFRPIKTDNSKYCVEPEPEPVREQTEYEKLMESLLEFPEERDRKKCEGKDKQLIADGPVIVAEEPESFSRGDKGHKRSNIILISDASLIQGVCGDLSTSQKPANTSFIQSLYPKTFQNRIKSEGTGAAGDPYGTDKEAIRLDNGKILQNTKAGGRAYEFTQKIMSPERSSPHKYYAASGLNRLTMRFDGGGSMSPASVDKFAHDCNYDPRKITRPKDPVGEDAIKKAKSDFRASMGSHGGTSLMSGVFDGKLYQDTNIGGAMPQIMLDTGSDHLDFDKFPSGCPGELFGYSVSIDSGRILVGSPFNGHIGDTVTDWDEFKTFPQSGIRVSHNGGDGTAYYYEKTYQASGVFGLKPWEFKKKIKASGTNVGYDDTDVTIAQSGWNLGSHNYTSNDLATHGFTTDMFGYDVALTSDFIAVGAPGHSYGNFHEHIFERNVGGVQYSGAFLRKDFDPQFDIPVHNMYDLGVSGVRAQYSTDSDVYPVTYSGGDLTVLNNGAVFTFVNDWTNFNRREKDWKFAEKIIPQGYNSRKQKSYSADFTPLPISGAENDHFGESISLNRALRTDGDYTLAVGSPHHMFATSGSHISSQPLPDAGATYVYDAMLRGQPPNLGSSGSWIMADVYGQHDKADKVGITIHQNQESSVVVRSSGQVLANNDGEIFLEASGFDPKSFGFIQHRPFIKLVHGDAIFGTSMYDLIYLHTEGSLIKNSGSMNMHTLGPNSAYVYNNIGMYVPSVLGSVSGEVPSGLVLYLDCPSGVWVSGAMPSGLPMHISGSAQTTEQLDLRVRGK